MCCVINDVVIFNDVNVKFSCMCKLFVIVLNRLWWLEFNCFFGGMCVFKIFFILWLIF